MRNYYLTFLTILLLLCCIENNAYSGYSMLHNKSSIEQIFTQYSSIQSPWSLEVGLGYGNYQDMIRSDGSTTLTRIGIAKEFIRSQHLRTGLELGAQTGNTARLNISEDIKNSLGGLPVDSP